MPRISPGLATQLLEGRTEPFVECFRHGSLSVEYYAPKGRDDQTPHSRDEVYVIVSGSGEFVLEGSRQDFETGEVLFVPAGAAHRFENFSEDFATWVFFYGPEGGEKTDDGEASS